jgi:hypothetical protein
VDARPEVSILYQLNGTLKSGPVIFTRETTIQGVVNTAANGGGTGVLWVCIFYYVLLKAKPGGSFAGAARILSVAAHSLCDLPGGAVKTGDDAPNRMSARAFRPCAARVASALHVSGQSPPARTPFRGLIRKRPARFIGREDDPT